MLDEALEDAVSWLAMANYGSWHIETLTRIQKEEDLLTYNRLEHQVHFHFQRAKYGGMLFVSFFVTN